MYGDLAYTTCSRLETAPDRLAPPPPAAANLARECNVYFLGAQTARILQVGRGIKDSAKTAWQTYMLDRDGHPIHGVSADWIAMLALIAYLVAMETRTGATLGSRAMGIRVIDATAPAEPGIPWRKVALRYLAMLIGLLPLLAVLVIYLGLYGSPDELRMLLVKLSAGESFISEVGFQAFQWHPFWAAALRWPGLVLGDGAPSLDQIEWLFDFPDLVLKGWIILLGVQIAMKRDPLYDRMAGTAVVRA
jgi:uncharacterized RDD family membrane protein YckC